VPGCEKNRKTGHEKAKNSLTYGLNFAEVGVFQSEIVKKSRIGAPWMSFLEVP